MLCAVPILRSTLGGGRAGIPRRVVAGASIEPVAAGPAFKHVVAVAALQRVAARAADKGVTGAAPGQVLDVDGVSVSCLVLMVWPSVLPRSTLRALRMGVIDRIVPAATVDKIVALVSGRGTPFPLAERAVVARSELDDPAGRGAVRAVVDVVPCVEKQKRRVRQGGGGRQSAGIRGTVVARAAENGKERGGDRAEIGKGEGLCSEVFEYPDPRGSWP